MMPRCVAACFCQRTASTRWKSGAEWSGLEKWPRAIRWICEGFLERTEPRLEVAPLIDRIGIDGLANLVGTHRLDHSLGLVEAQASLLERQIAVSEQSAYLTLEIGDQILVLHAMDAPRQHAVKVPHQMHIVAVVAAEIPEVVGKPDAGLKMLLEIGKAAGERPTARIDDLRIRQEQVNQADVIEVGRHLVDKARPAEYPVRTGLREVAVAEGGQLRAVELRDRGRVGRRLAGALQRAELQGEARDVRKLPCAFHLRMAGENLLE